MKAYPLAYSMPLGAVGGRGIAMKGAKTKVVAKQLQGFGCNEFKTGKKKKIPTTLL